MLRVAGALLHLKRKKQAEKQMEQSYGMISNLEAQINALQSAALTKEHVDVVSLANRQLKAVQVRCTGSHVAACGHESCL
jgi:hypothetical protein